MAKTESTTTIEARIGKLSGHVVHPEEALPSIPRRRYIDEDFYSAELEQVFGKSWLLVAHESEFSRTGSYKLIDWTLSPAFVVRDENGKLRAFLNSCAHRGASVLRNRTGCSKRLSCQYHGWTYDTAGNLVGVPDEDNFGVICKGEHRLSELKCDQWGGFVFVNFEMESESVGDRLGGMAKDFSYIANADLKIVGSQTWEVECNWKAQFDNFCESYHVNFIHRKTAAKVVDAKQSFVLRYEHGCGLNLNPFRDTGDSSVHLDWHSAELKHHLELGHSLVLFPNSMMVISSQGAVNLFNIWPISPRKCRLDLITLAPDWGDGPIPQKWKSQMEGVEAIAIEDYSCMASIQLTMESDPDRKIPLSTQEALIANYHIEIDRLIGRNAIDKSMLVQNCAT